MRTGRPKKALELTADEREKLVLLWRRPKSSQALAMRARIVLHCAEGLANDKVAHKLGVTRPTVGKCARAFACGGLRDCWTNHGPVLHGRLPTNKWKM